MKNENRRDIGAGDLDKRNMFISIFQIILTGIFDFKDVGLEESRNENENKIFRIVGDVENKGPGVQTYTLRGRILKALYPITENEILPDTLVIDCEDNVGSLANELFKNTPSYSEQYTCNVCNTNMNSIFETYAVPLEEMRESGMSKIISRFERLTTRPRTCSKCGNDMTINVEIGTLVLLDVLSKNPNDFIHLSEIPLSIELEKNQNYVLNLLGIVNFISNDGRKDTMDHCNAIVRRNDETFWKFNDLSISQEKISVSTQINPPPIILKINRNKE